MEDLRLSSTLPVAEYTSDFQDMMSAHEAGHATLGISLGARIEAVYAVVTRAPNSPNFLLLYKTKFGDYARTGLNSKDKILLVAGGGAGEFLLNGTYDKEIVQDDRKRLEDNGIWNYEYCVKHAIDRLAENRVLLAAVRDRIRLSMVNLKQCKLAKKGSHIILAAGAEIERLFRDKGYSVNSDALDFEIAKLRGDRPSEQERSVL